jgi:high-affinity iron transporter
MRAFNQGRRAEANRLFLDAYLEGLEPVEPRLRARDPEATVAVEAAFHDLRGAARGGAPPTEVEARAAALDRRLAGLDAARPIVPFLSALLIFLREGVEAALIVGALLAGARRLGRRDGVRFIHAGWIAALPLGVATWWVFDRVIAIGAGRRDLVEGLVGLAAALVLFSVSFWMISKAESRRWMAYLQRSLQAHLSRRNLAVLSGLAFLAVYREAAETVLFTQALVLESSGRGGEIAAGAALGLVLVGGVALLLSRAVVRLPLGPFFAVSGVLLCALAVSFAGSGVHELVASGILEPRPVPFPEIPWMGIHPDLAGLAVQLTIVLVIAAAGLLALRRAPADAVPVREHPRGGPGR